MAHFAKVVNGLVTQVIVAEPEFFDSFVDPTPGEWIQTSYNTYGGEHRDPVTGQLSEDQSKALRKNYAGIGFSYDAELDAFIPPKPYNSWVLDEESCLWFPPVPYPTDTSRPDGQSDVYIWNESIVNWEKVSEEE